jgi:hypothetical protein
MRSMEPKSVLSVAAVEPFPILRASAQWCAVFGVQEADVKGCGFKAFDTDFRPLVQVRIASSRTNSTNRGRRCRTPDAGARWTVPGRAWRPWLCVRGACVGVLLGQYPARCSATRCTKLALGCASAVPAVECCWGDIQRAALQTGAFSMLCKQHARQAVPAPRVAAPGRRPLTALAGVRRASSQNLAAGRTSRRRSPRQWSRPSSSGVPYTSQLFWSLIMPGRPHASARPRAVLC